jgi:hypothetical protein
VVENVLVLDRRLFVLDVQNEQNTDTPLMTLLSYRNHNHSQSSLPLVMSRGPRKRLHKAEKSSGQDVPHYHSFKMLIGKKERHLILAASVTPIMKNKHKRIRGIYISKISHHHLLPLPLMLLPRLPLRLHMLILNLLSGGLEEKEGIWFRLYLMSSPLLLKFFQDFI